MEILEQGRGILFRELQRYRTPLEDLPDRTLAARFAKLSCQLEGSLVSGPKVGVTAEDSGRRAFMDDVGM